MSPTPTSTVERVALPVIRGTVILFLVIPALLSVGVAGLLDALLPDTSSNG